MSADEDAEVIDLVAEIDRRARMPSTPKIRFPRRTKNGPYPHIENTEALLKAYGVEVSFNLMTHEAEHSFRDGFDVAAECQRNAAEAQIREWANEHRIYKSARFADQMFLIMSRKAYHPVADWLRTAEWDGEDRIGPLFESLTLHPKFRKHADIARRCLQAWLVTAAKAAMLPMGTTQGVAAQGVLVLQGKQGKNKTRWLMSLVPEGSGWAKDGVSLDTRDRDSKQQATASWIVELGELDGTFRKTDIAHLKAFLTSRVDTYRKAYAKSHENIARRTVFVASVNENRYLVDDTGSRRFWSIAIVSANPAHGIDLKQLWAQAAHLAVESPEMGWLTAEEAKLLEAANKGFEAIDPYADDILRLFRINKAADRWLSFHDIRREIRPQGQWTKGETTALGKALVKLEVPERGAKGGARLFALEPRSEMERRSG